MNNEAASRRTTEEVPASLPLSNSDDFGRLLEGDDNAQNIHFEWAPTQRADIARFRAAVVAAAASHPMLCARLDAHTFGPPRWILHDSPNVAFEVHAVTSRAEEARLRSRAISEKLDLARASVRVWVLRGGEGDTVVFAVHHAVCDGMGVLRFVTSVLRQYEGLPDPRALPPESGVRDPGESRALLRRVSPLLRHLSRALVRGKASIHGGTDGYRNVNHFVFRSVPQDALRAARGGSAQNSEAPTLNDLLLATLHVAVERWNQMHGQRTFQVIVASPVNIRPKEHWLEPVGNYSSAFATTTIPSDRDSLSSAASAIARQTGAFKRWHTPHALFRWMNRLPHPSGFSRLVASTLAAGSSGTAILSNLGHLEHASVPLRGEGMAPKHVRFSPPMPLGVALAVGVVLHEGRCSVTFRYRETLWGPAAASDFADLFCRLASGPA